MTNMGILALIIEDRPKEDAYWVLHLSLANGGFAARQLSMTVSKVSY